MLCIDVVLQYVKAASAYCCARASESFELESAGDVLGILFCSSAQLEKHYLLYSLLRSVVLVMEAKCLC